MPYHLMLQKFLLSGGQSAFFDAFYWALSIGYSIPPEDGLDADLPEFTGEFLDSWLVLLEKMVNPKTVLESPHTLPKTASKTTGGNYKPFDPLKYVFILVSGPRHSKIMKHKWKYVLIDNILKRFSSLILNS